MTMTQLQTTNQRQNTTQRQTTTSRSDEWPGIRYLRSYERKHGGVLFELWKSGRYKPNAEGDEQMAKMLRGYLGSSFPGHNLWRLTGLVWKKWRLERARVEGRTEWLGRVRADKRAEEVPADLFGDRGAPAAVIVEGVTFDGIGRIHRIGTRKLVELRIEHGEEAWEGVLLPTGGEAN